jgi:ferredoxin
MHVEADRTKCCGFGNCVLIAPEVFDISDEDGRVVIIGQVTDDNLAIVREAVASCPNSALSLSEDR